MAQSHPWLTLADASSVLGIPEFQVLDLAVSGRLHSRLKHDHREVCAADVVEFASELATSSGDVLAEHADKPIVRGGPELPLHIEDEYTRERNT